jgi:hypothetical protein
MKTIILDKKVKRLRDGKELTCIIPDPELGYYSSLMEMLKEGYDISLYIEDKLVELNPTRFELV